MYRSLYVKLGTCIDFANIVEFASCLKHAWTGVSKVALYALMGPGPEKGSLLGDGGVVRCLFLAGIRYQQDQQIESFAEPEQQKKRQSDI